MNYAAWTYEGPVAIECRADSAGHHFQAVCPCGWRGEGWHTSGAARNQAQDHLRVCRQREQGALW